MYGERQIPEGLKAEQRNLSDLRDAVIKESSACLELSYVQERTAEMWLHSVKVLIFLQPNSVSIILFSNQ